MAFSPQIEQWRRLPLAELTGQALAVKRAHRGDAFSLCSIINAKSGRCSEDCRFCAQSAHYRAEAPVYPLKGEEEVVAAAREAKRIGASHFSLVTSGRGVTGPEVEQVASLVRAIREKVGIAVCASLGIMNAADLARLKAAGLSRYHHNLESSASFFPRICTTHDFSDRVATIEAARAAGLEVCAGGIFGLGESEADRIAMALTLRELAVDSVPLNFLVPLAGTPLAGAKPLTVAELLRAIALYRLLLPAVPIRLCGGRERALADFMSAALLAGADGMMIGGYLTQRGRPPELDHRLVEETIRIWTS